MLIQLIIPFYPSNDDCFVSLQLALKYRSPEFRYQYLKERNSVISNKYDEPTKKRDHSKISDSG